MLPLAIHWNVDPVLIQIGSFGLRWYSLMFLIAFSLGYIILVRMYRHESVRENYMESLLLYVFLAVLIGARLGHCLFYEPEYFLTSEHWVEMIWPFHNGQFTGFQGLASHGAAIGILLALWFYWRKYMMNPVWILDRMVIVVALGGAFIRLGNLFNSEIYGTVTDLPWGFVFERAQNDPDMKDTWMLPKHPTQLYESLSYFIIFGVSLWYYLHKKAQFKTGTIFGWWLGALFGMRLLIEFVKNDQVDFEAGMVLNMGQLLSLPFIVGGLVIAWLAHKEKFPQGPFPKGENAVVVAKWKANEEKEKKKKQ